MTDSTSDKNIELDWDVVVVGSANTDYVIQGTRLPFREETLEGERFLEFAGGKGVNQAIAAARFGAKTAFIGRIGSDAHGDRIVETLRLAGVETSFVQRDPLEATGVSLIMVDSSGNRQSITTPGANANLTPKDIYQAKSLLSQAKTVLTQLTLSLESLISVLQLSAGEHTRILLDPSPPRNIPREIFRLIDIIKPNISEAEYLTGLQVYDRESARVAAEKLLWFGVGAVIVESGKKGNLLLWDEHEKWFPVIPLKAIDKTGAGDALVGVTAASLSQGATLPQATECGNAAAALATTVLGASAAMPTRNAVFDLIRKASRSYFASSA